MRILLIAIALACLILSASGCARSPGGVAASNIPLAPGGYTEIGDVSASDCKINLLGILPVSGSNYISDAMHQALREESDADALINITVERVFKYFILWSQMCTEVRATAVRVP
jgi:hypothetical protein